MCTTLTDMLQGEIHTSTITLHAHNDSRPCSRRNGQALREIRRCMSVFQLDGVQGLKGIREALIHQDVHLDDLTMEMRHDSKKNSMLSSMLQHENRSDPLQ